MTRCVVSFGLSAGVWAALVVASGCGGMSQPRLDRVAGRGPSSCMPDGRVSVSLGKVVAGQGAREHATDDALRYLRDVAADALGRSVCFLWNDATMGDTADGETDGRPRVGTTVAAAPEATLEIEVLRIEERLGPTVRLVAASGQTKQVIARVRLVLRTADGAAEYATEQEGRARKGAWGVLAVVRRDAMRSGAAEWGADGSMVGLACGHAVEKGIKDLETRFLEAGRRGAGQRSLRE